jgi:osmotically inducible protein OsmC
MPTRTARTAWNGTLQEGSGQVELSSSHVGTFEVSFPKRAADDAGGTTSPEELIAAAHAACYCMALSHELGEAGFPPDRLEASAECSFEQQGGGWGITSMHLSVRGTVPGCPPDTFGKLAGAAKDGCPVSKALAGNVEISLDAALATG